MYPYEHSYAIARSAMRLIPDVFAFVSIIPNKKAFGIMRILPVIFKPSWFYQDTSFNDQLVDRITATKNLLFVILLC